MIPLDSSALRGADFDPATQQMFIWFHGSGHAYTFYHVPAAVFQGLLNAIGWHGEYYNRNIRGRYRP